MIVFRDAHPVAQAVEQKAERRPREVVLAEAGLSPQEIKVARKKRNLGQEEHYDNCGIDLGPIDDKSVFSALAVGWSLGAAGGV